MLLKDRFSPMCLPSSDLFLTPSQHPLFLSAIDKSIHLWHQFLYSILILRTTIGLLIYTLISDLRKQGQFQTLENIQVLQIQIFLLGLHPEKKSWVYTINQEKKSGSENPRFFSGWQPGKISGVQIKKQSG
jgi:hypothetical protein